MTQLSLLGTPYQLAGVMTAIRAAMRATAGAPDGEGRKALPDRMNAIARQAGIRLTQGNKDSVSKDTLDKWLAPSDASHPPSILAILAFCVATADYAPLRAMLHSIGLDIMTPDDRKMCEYGRAMIEQKRVKKLLRKLEEEL